MSEHRTSAANCKMANHGEPISSGNVCNECDCTSFEADDPQRLQDAIEAVADDIIRRLIYDWTEGYNELYGWEYYPDIGEYDWNRVESEVRSRIVPTDGPALQAIEYLKGRAVNE